MPQVLDRVSRVALDLVFPPRCALCGAGGALVCDACMAALPAAAHPRCERCWEDVRRGRMCAHCASAAPAFVRVRAPFAHDGGARGLVHELKYRGLSSLAEPMGRAMAPLAEASGADVIVPVPLHAGRERSRGYNQAERLARAIALETGLPAARRAARRTRATTPLVRSMGREERRRIVAGAFSARRELVEGRDVLLVDDVVTTGATLDACARAVLAAGARRVSGLSFARA